MAQTFNGGTTTVTKAFGTTNTANTNVDGSLCIYNAGSDIARIIQRLGAVGKIRIEFFYL